MQNLIHPTAVKEKLSKEVVFDEAELAYLLTGKYIVDADAMSRRIYDATNMGCALMLDRIFIPKQFTYDFWIERSQDTLKVLLFRAGIEPVSLWMYYTPVQVPDVFNHNLCVVERDGEYIIDTEPYAVDDIIANLQHVPNLTVLSSTELFYSCGYLVLRMTSMVDMPHNGLRITCDIEGTPFAADFIELTYPFKLSDFMDAVHSVNESAYNLWQSTHGCPDCGEVDDDMGGFIAVNPECKSCGGMGQVL